LATRNRGIWNNLGWSAINFIYSFLLKKEKLQASKTWLQAKHKA
jgi:hypothetical protein